MSLAERAARWCPRRKDYQRRIVAAETAGGELRARVSDLWSGTLRWDVQLAGSQPRDRRKIFTHARAVKDVTLQDATVSAACVASGSIDWNGHGTERRQSSLVLYQARSRTRKVWILQGLRRMPCGSVGRRGVETSWQGVPRALRRAGHRLQGSS